MKFNDYCIVLRDPLRNVQKTVMMKALNARSAAVAAVDEFGPDGYYVVKDVRLVG